ncbi:hypothetical protein EDC19_2023 [Natranaerovirga hydrolytica]|uniref:Uncharacterized protein n=1 Tax=Natranaerovirga hydrolytica TaxID=680378 RepID=A0A4R1MK10_9FIRM|nr:hypothetical protein [Natranaerovirga hydrolytica]TCK92867.1 hypothetical protein EDC19_2023 [Natranaerovirga hydrolytica]
MNEKLKEYYLLNDIPIEFKRYDALVKKLNTQRFSKKIAPLPKTDTLHNTPNNESLMMLTLFLLLFDEK